MFDDAALRERALRVLGVLDGRAAMSAASINDLPDAAFAYIEPGGHKDAEGKTVPRSLRHFPIHDAAHVRNALARAGQSPFGEKAMPKIRKAAKKFGVEVSEPETAPRSQLRHLPGKHSQDSHGNDVGVNVVPGDKLKLAKRLTPAAAQEMQDEMMLAGRPWTAEHMRSLRAWTTSGYNDIRMMINNPDHEPFLGIGGPATVKAHIRNIHSAMRPLPKPVKVFRKTDRQGVGLGKGDDPKLLVGKRKQNTNFTATSIEPDAGFLGAPRSIHIEIEVPAGTPAAYLESITETKGEHELLLDAGAVLEFTDARDRGDGVTVLKARVVS